ncbi:MAG: hypothetical protein Pg6C_13930 [Treponemataceae bacterium]|nr:MAG: hypothetical protein Pg6C_13930 [Treponemataceae bacterium]
MTSMETLGNTVFFSGDTEFIRAGLAAVSVEMRRSLKDMAQSLVIAQSRLVFPLPEWSERLAAKNGTDAASERGTG